MKRKVFATITATLTLLFTPLTTLSTWATEKQSLASTSDTTVTLDLYNLTDIHGHIEKVTNSKGEVTEAGLSAMACYIENAKQTQPNSSFTLLGDNIGASPFLSGILKDNPTIAALNAMSPVASTIGNHELDLGQQAFKDRIQGKNGFTKISFPYLGASVKGLEGFLQDYVIWHSPAGIKVAFIGAIAQDVPEKLDKGTTTGLSFLEPVAVINSLAKNLKASGTADIVIAMLDDDTKNNFPRMGAAVDGLMGGDTHVPYAFTQVKGAEGNLLSATASGSHTDNLANLQLVYDTRSRQVVSSQAILIPANEIAKCQPTAATQPVVNQIENIITQAQKAAGEKGNLVLSSTIDRNFARGIFQVPGEIASPGSNRGTESTLGDLVADAFRDSITHAGVPIDIGMIMAGGIRADLLPNNGQITYRQVFDVLPFSDDIGYVKITGADLKNALEEQWKELSPQNSRPLLKLSLSRNVSYTYDWTKPFGERITSITINSQPYDPQAFYTVGSVKFLLEGGDGFTSLTKGGAPTLLPKSSELTYDRDYFADYLKRNPQVSTRSMKHSIGVNLPEKATDGQPVKVSLRGLSFTEGNIQPSQVSLALGGNPVIAEVNNSIEDAKANTSEAVITTDGAGQVQALVSVNAQCHLHQGKEVFVPLSLHLLPEHTKISLPVGVKVFCPSTQNSDSSITFSKQINNPSINFSSLTDKDLASTGMKTLFFLWGSLLVLLFGIAIVFFNLHRVKPNLLP